MGGDNGQRKGEGFSGTPIKDTWTNSRREVGSWVGSGDGYGGGSDEGEMETTVLEQQVKNFT